MTCLRRCSLAKDNEQMLKQLQALCDAVMTFQDHDERSPHRGALFCPYHQDHHSRGGEAAFPLVYLGQLQKDSALVASGLELADWLVSRQEDDGAWPETPGYWRGTTVFQLLSLAALIDVCGSELDENRREKYGAAALKAAQWTSRNVTPRKTMTNYIASGGAALAVLARSYPGQGLDRKARRLARQAASRINADGLVEGEGRGRRILKKIYIKSKSIDIGYGLEMTLASLSLAARLLGDAKLAAEVQRSLEAHLYFIYPDGSLDNSLGSRAYKWSLYGSKTAHGSQMALAFGASTGDGRALRAMKLTTRYLGSQIFTGIVGQGPHPPDDPQGICIYPTFIRACSLALALAYHGQGVGTEQSIPADEDQWIKTWPSLNSLSLKRTPWMATVSGYTDSTTYAGVNGLKRFQVPGAGAVTYLYHQQWGPVQASTQLEYQSVELLHVPQVADPPPSLSPRVGISGPNGGISWFWSLHVQIESREQGDTVEVEAMGSFDLNEPNGKKSPARITRTIRLTPREITKTYLIFLESEADRKITIIEPLIVDDQTVIQNRADGLSLIRDDCELLISATGAEGLVRIDSDPVTWAYPLPSLKATAAVFALPAQGRGEYGARITININ